MKKGTKIALWVSLGSFLLGCILLVAGIMGGGLQVLKNRIPYFSEAWWEQKQGVFDELDSFRAEEITSIEVDADFSNVTVVRSDDEYCRVYATSNFFAGVDCLVDEGTLCVVQHANGWFGNGKSYIKIELPDKQYRDCELSVDAGKLQVDELLLFGPCRIEVDAGAVEIGTLTAQYVEVDCDAGQCRIQNLVSDGLQVDCDAGTLTLGYADVKDAEINLDAGTLSLTLAGERSDYEIDGEYDLAKAEIEGGRGNTRYSDGKRSVWINCDLGSVTVNFQQQEKNFQQQEMGDEPKGASF